MISFQAERFRLMHGDGICCPTFYLAPWERSSLFSSLFAWLKTESQAQRNNCTKYSLAVTIETSAGASLTSPTVFHFALDPEKHWEVDVQFFSSQNLGCIGDITEQHGE